MTIASKLSFGRRAQQDRRSSGHEQHDIERKDREVVVARRLARCRRCTNGQQQSQSSVSQPNVITGIHHHQLQSKKATGDVEAAEYVTSRVSSTIIGHELDQHLPSFVLQARARLLERLSDLHLTESRKHIIARDASLCEYRHPEELNLCETEIEPHLLHSDSIRSILLLQANQIQYSDTVTQKIPLLVRDYPCRFHEEVFTRHIVFDENETGLLECSICLEKFSDGEKVMRLPCGHIYHHSCIQPWVQVNGVCPYCRAILTS